VISTTEVISSLIRTVAIPILISPPVQCSFHQQTPQKKKIQEGGRPSLNPAIWEIADELELHAALTEKN
jgi:hypothetical protein